MPSSIRPRIASVERRRSERRATSLLAFAEQGCRFVAPVFVGETVTTRFEVASVERKPGRDVALVRFDVTLVTKAAETVLRGHHTYLLRCRPAAGATA